MNIINNVTSLYAIENNKIVVKIYILISFIVPPFLFFTFSLHIDVAFVSIGDDGKETGKNRPNSRNRIVLIPWADAFNHSTRHSHGAFDYIPKSIDSHERTEMRAMFRKAEANEEIFNQV